MQPFIFQFTIVVISYDHGGGRDNKKKLNSKLPPNFDGPNQEWELSNLSHVAKKYKYNGNPSRQIKVMHPLNCHGEIAASFTFVPGYNGCPLS